MTEPFVFTRSARSRATAIAVLGLWGVLLAAWLWLDAALWIVIPLALFGLPALYDLVADPKAGLRLEDDTISWFSGQRTATLALEEIDHMRLDTRLDFSVRASAVLKTGRKIRLPFESTPPHQAFEDALLARGLKVQRHHFQLFQ